MLAAVLNGKRRGTGFAGKHLELSGLEGAEDVLTATVFERLAYLPESLLETFFDRLLDLDDPIGPLEDQQFWPLWALDGHSVEPDVVFYGGMRTLLVEAKRYDDGLGQYAQQLARELKAGAASNFGLQRPVLLTIGGLQDYSDATVERLSQQIDAELNDVILEYELVCRSWHQLYLALQVAVADANADCQSGLKCLLDDIAATYEWHGLRTQAPRWLAELNPIVIHHDSYPISKSFHAPEVISHHLPQLNNLLAQLPAPGIASSVFPIKYGVFFHEYKH
jgi:hypothetical protein